MVLLECVKRSTSKTYTQVRFSTMNGRSTKKQKRFEKSDLSTLEASLRVVHMLMASVLPAHSVSSIPGSPHVHSLSRK